MSQGMWPVSTSNSLVARSMRRSCSNSLPRLVITYTPRPSAVNCAPPMLAGSSSSLTGVSAAVAMSRMFRCDSLAETKLTISSLVSSGDHAATDQFFWKPLNTRRGGAVVAGSAMYQVVTHAVARRAVERDPAAVVAPHRPPFTPCPELTRRTPREVLSYQ